MNLFEYFSSNPNPCLLVLFFFQFFILWEFFVHAEIWSYTQNSFPAPTLHVPLKTSPSELHIISLLCLCLPVSISLCLYISVSISLSDFLSPSLWLSLSLFCNNLLGAVTVAYMCIGAVHPKDLPFLLETSKQTKLSWNLYWNFLQVRLMRQLISLCNNPSYPLTWYVIPFVYTM